MREALTDLPDSLEALYKDVLVNKIPKDYSEKARLMLLWLCYSLRPLTLQELACVASLPDPQDVLEICNSSLVSLRVKESGEHFFYSSSSLLSDEELEDDYDDSPSLSLRTDEEPEEESDDNPSLSLRTDEELEEDYHDSPSSSLCHLRQEESLSTQTENEYNDIGRQTYVQLDHFSVKEYLTSEHLLALDETADFYVTPLVANLTIAQISVAHLLETNERDLDSWRVIKETLELNLNARFEPPGSDPLLHYSATWFKHIQNADAVSDTIPKSVASGPEANSAVAQSDADDMRVQCHRLFCEEYSQSFQNWCCLLSRDDLLHGTYFYLDLLGEQCSPMFIASALNLPDNVRRLLNNGDDIDGDLHGCSDPTTRRIKPIEVAAIEGI